MLKILIDKGFSTDATIDEGPTLQKYIVSLLLIIYINTLKFLTKNNNSVKILIKLGYFYFT